MTVTVGVDWGSNGWVCARLADGEWTASIEPSILSVWRRYGDGTGTPLLVDIPIGLPAEGWRACDRAAKTALGDRGASVFLTPPRPALDAETYADAKAITEARTDGSLTVQAWHILPRVREVDDLLQSAEAPGTAIRESHPEVCFRALAGGRDGARDGGDARGEGGLTDESQLVSKHDAAGVDARIALLEASVPGAAAAYDDLVATHIDDLPSHARRFRAGNDDDILDAMCLAVAGRLAAADGGFRRYGGDSTDPVLDRPVEIVYPPT
jgi:predicted RNase H-like nuclease